MSQSEFRAPLKDLSHPVNVIATCIEEASGKAYQADLKYTISEVAGYYYASQYQTKSNALSGGEYRAEAMQVLRIAKQDLYARGSETDIQQMQEHLDKRLPRTRFKIPAALRSLPLYPSQKDRCADPANDVRKLFDHPVTEQERQTLFNNAKNYMTVSNAARPVEVAMHRINSPFNHANC